MTENNFEYYRNEIYQFIQDELLFFDEFESCKMYILPEYLEQDVEYILKLSDGFNENQLYALKRKFENDIYRYCKQLGNPYYFLRIILIFI